MSLKTDPNLRPFLMEIERIVDDLKHRLPCCPNCIYWDGLCTYKGQRIMPPPEVIAFGCWAYEQEVPF